MRTEMFTARLETKPPLGPKVRPPPGPQQLQFVFLDIRQRENFGFSPVRCTVAAEGEAATRLRRRAAQ
jgi:hypothetical protein